MVTPNSADGVDVFMAEITMEEYPEMDYGSDLGSDGERGEEMEKGGLLWHTQSLHTGVKLTTSILITLEAATNQIANCASGRLGRGHLCWG